MTSVATAVFAQPVVLEGTHVRLEPMRIDHAPALTEVGLDPDLWRVTVSRIRSAADMVAYVETAIELGQRGLAIPFVTVDRANGRIVGSTRFGNIDPANRRVEIGWTWIAKPWQRTGINTEAKYLMLRHAFDQLHCIRVEFKTDALNTRSRTAILRLGATEEGVLRSHMVVAGGRIRDTVYFSVIDRDWPRVRDHLEHKMAGHGNDIVG